MISTLILFAALQAALSKELPIEYDTSDPISSHPQMMGLVNGIYERNVRRGLTNPSTLSADDRVNIVNLHNKIRSETARGLYQGSGTLLPQAANMAELKYSRLLEAVATEWSGYCNFEHRGSNSPCNGAMSRFKNTYPPEWDNYVASAGCGENLYGSGADPAWTAMFGDTDYGIRGGIEDSWCIGEAKTWTFGMSMGSAGHYTAVIWDTTRYVGCGFKQCPSSNGWMKNMFTCNYYPAGNGFFGDRNGPYTRGTPCSDCPSDLQYCTTGDRPGLCTDNDNGGNPTPQPTVPTPQPTNPTPQPTPPTPQPTMSTQQDSPTTSPITPDPTQPTPQPTQPTPQPTVPTPQPTDPTPMPTPPTTETNCLQISDFTGNLNGLNGLWTPNGDDFVKDQYTLTQYSGYNGFYGTNENSPNWNTYGWCQANSVLDCSNRWYTGSAYVSVTFIMTGCGDSGPTPTPRPTTSPVAANDAGASENCVQIEQLDINVPSTSNGNVLKSLNDGTWQRRSEDFNGYPCYEWSEDNYYLYTLEYYNWYTISTSIGSMSSLRGWCGSNVETNIPIFDCNGEWNLNGKDSNSIFRQCNSQAFNFEPCLDDPIEGLCFYKNNNDNTIPMEFSVFEDEGCLNDQPVYIYQNSSQNIYYIHYDAANVMWKLSVNRVEENEIYVCEKENVLECTAGSWIKLIEGFGIQSFEAMESGRIEVCDVETDEISDDNSGVSTGIIVAIGVIVLFVCCIALIIGGLCFYKREKMRKEVTFDHANKDKTSDKVPMATDEAYDDKQGDTVNIGTDDEDEQL